MKAMNISLAIMALYPHAFPGDYSIVDHSDGRGPQIETWSLTDPATGAPIPIPTKQEIIIGWARHQDAAAWAALRAERNLRLAMSDIHVMPDRWESYPPPLRDEWAAYRRALRDLPDTTANPSAPHWPPMPAEGVDHA